VSVLKVFPTTVITVITVITVVKKIKIIFINKKYELPNMSFIENPSTIFSIKTQNHNNDIQWKTNFVKRET
jgi:hypothetical protein